MSAIAKIKAALSATQSDLARITGRNQASVSRWLSGQSVPNLTDLQKLRAEFHARGIPWSDDFLIVEASSEGEAQQPTAAA